MNKYKKYKPSGVEWIGEIPEHWEAKRSKYLLNFQKGKLPKEQFTIQVEDTIPYLSMEFLRGKPKQLFYAKMDGNITVDEGDILLLWDGANAGEFIVGMNGVLSSTMAKCSIKSILDKAFTYYFLKNYEIELRKDTIGMGIPHVNGETLSNVFTPLPPLPEQTQIANFLDRKTEQIEDLITKKEQLIKLLEEEKIAVINEAVTKGINPNVKLKDSGIEWLGEIPEHWEVKRLKYVVSKVGSGVTPRGGSSVYQKSGIPLLRSQNIHFEGIKLHDVAYISEDIHNDMPNSKVKFNDVLLNITGASIGRCAVFNHTIEANVNQHVCIIRPTEGIIPFFLFYFLSSMFGQVQIDMEQTGSGREGLNFEAIKHFILPTVKIEEQTQIVNYIEKETTRIDKTIETTKKLIELLKEYRTALISETVTGKIKVFEGDEL